MKFIAHRGFHINKDEENTLKSFKNAINNPKFVGFEFDIRETLDGKFIVNHNAFIKKDLIKSYTYKYLKNKYNVITLNEVLNLSTDKIMLIEIKDFKINYQKILKIFKKHVGKNMYVMSFHNEVIEKLKTYNPNVKLGILNYILNTSQKYDLDFICLLNSLASDKIVNNYLNQDIEVFMYGVINEEKDLYYKKAYYIVDKEPK